MNLGNSTAYSMIDPALLFMTNADQAAQLRLEEETETEEMEEVEVDEAESEDAADESYDDDETEDEEETEGAA